MEGGTEEKLTGELALNFWGQWAVSTRGLFFAVFPPSGTRSAIRRLTLQTREVMDVVALFRMPVQFDSGMSVAADESWLSWAQLDQASSGVYVVNGFR